MNFDQLDRQMRTFETAADYCVLPGIYMVARLDGRGFTRLTKSELDFEKPFDERFRDLMVRTAQSLMSGGFRVVYAYTQSDEISLLFALDEGQFGRKLRKYNSLLAAQASATFSLELGRVVTFDCRISQMPNVELVVDYFRWRSEDAVRNALSAHCYWILRKQGLDEVEATKQLDGVSSARKNELLFQAGINFNDLPAWQKRGVGLYWSEFEKPGLNPITGAKASTRRRRLVTNFDLPRKDDLSQLIRQLAAWSECSG